MGRILRNLFRKAEEIIEASQAQENKERPPNGDDAYVHYQRLYQPKGHSQYRTAPHVSGTESP